MRKFTDLLRQELDDMRTRESEELSDIEAPNSYAAGWCSGVVATVDHLKEFLNEHEADDGVPELLAALKGNERGD